MHIQPQDDSIVPWERGVRLGGEMNREVMAKNLLDFKTVMDKHGIPFVLTFGTLLGVMREKNFILHDSDVDVICFGNDTSNKYHWKMKKVKLDLEQIGFAVSDMDEGYLNYDYFIRDGEKIEIWWFHHIDNEYIFTSTIRYNEKYLNKSDTVDFLETKFLIPSNAEEVLEITYGIDWRTPQPKNTSAGCALNLNPSLVEERLKKYTEIKKLKAEELALQEKIKQVNHTINHLKKDL